MWFYDAAVFKSDYRNFFANSKLIELLKVLKNELRLKVDLTQTLVYFLTDISGRSLARDSQKGR